MARITLVKSNQSITKAYVVAAVLIVGLSAHAAPPTLETAQSAIKTFCARTYANGSQDWTLCVSQGTQGYVEFADAYRQADPPLKGASSSARRAMAAQAIGRSRAGARASGRGISKNSGRTAGKWHL